MAISRRKLLAGSSASLVALATSPAIAVAQPTTTCTSLYAKSPSFLHVFDVVKTSIQRMQEEVSWFEGDLNEYFPDLEKWFTALDEGDESLAEVLQAKLEGIHQEFSHSYAPGRDRYLKKGPEGAYHLDVAAQCRYLTRIPLILGRCDENLFLSLADLAPSKIKTFAERV